MKIQVFLKISVLKKFANFSGKHLRWETPAMQAPRPATCNFVKKRPQHMCFSVKFLRTPFSTEQIRWMLFKISNLNNLFKDASAISLTHNQSLITCNSHNSKLIRKCIHLPKPCFHRAFL